jgi:hypothetical protein
MIHNANIEEIVRIANSKITSKHWKIYEDNIILLGDFVRLFYQAKSLVDHNVFDEEHTIYGIGVFLVHIETHDFHNVSCIEDIPRMPNLLNSSEPD